MRVIDFLQLRQLLVEYNTHQITVSTSTIRRRLRAAGIASRRHYRGAVLVHRRRQLRLEYA